MNFKASAQHAGALAGGAAPAPCRHKRPRRLYAALVQASGADNAAAATPRVVVIGAGAGGLATAGRLAKAGLDVTVLEKNEQVGGRVQSSTSASGVRHDTGPSLLLFPDKYREAFAALGTSLEEQGVQLARVGPAAYRVFFEQPFPDGRRSLDLLNDPDAMAAQLEGVEAGASEGYRRFLKMARRHLDMGVPYFIEREFEDLASARGLQDLLPLLPELNVLDLLGQHDWRLKQFFSDQRLRATFTFQDLYVGLSPYSAPAVFGLLAGTELTDGVWYPLGGFATVRDGLLRAAEACGVRVQTGAEVAAIATDTEDGRVTGVVLADGSSLPADYVVCNRDLPAGYALLDPSGSGGSSGGAAGGTDGTAAAAAAAAPAAAAAYGRQQHDRLGQLKYSAGVIAFNWSLSRRVEGLTHHNVFLSGDWGRAWQLAARPEELPASPNFYLHAPARTDPSAAPPGRDSVMVLLPVACQQQMPGGGGTAGGSAAGGGSSAAAADPYGPLVEAGRQRVLATLEAAGLGDVGAAIEEEFVITPPQWEARYGLRHGAAFGLSHGLDQLSLFRPANRDTRIAGLYFVGASTRPGNGVPLCLIGAKLTAERLLKEVQQRQR